MKDGINKNTDLKLLAKTVTGLEEILSQELLRAGGRDIEILHRAVSFTGDLGTVYKANLMVRTALRILIPFAGFRVRNDKELYNVINDYPWEELMDVGDTLAIDTVLNTDNFNHSQYVSQKIKDAIVDRFRSKFGSRPDIDLDNPTIRLNAHINEDVCTIALDSSGESLHKRGYRELTNKAPINEVLAAGLVMLTGWNGRGNFIDPMCGSGTFLIEAALIAANIPPGYYRTGYGFMKWKKYLPFDSELWETIYNAAIDRINSEPVSIAGSDISPNVVKKA